MSPFKPAWWLRNPHLQTLWPHLFRRDIKDIMVRRERFELPDGDFLDLDWLGPEHNGAPIVIIMHGFEGSINSHYSKGLMRSLSLQGWRAVFMHFRGCSGHHNRLHRSYHSGETTDIQHLVQALQEREPNAPITAIGFSLGGNVLLKWLGETGEKNPLTAAIAVSVPLELHKTVVRINQGFSRVYEKYFLNCAIRRLKEKFKLNPGPINISCFEAIDTMRDFDNHVTAPLHGFANADEYYKKSSSRQFLRGIKVPTLVIHAKDDPFMTEDVIPTEDELSPHVMLEVSEKGGHVGFVAGKVPWRAEYWIEQRVPEFLQRYF
jgi:predicted alpha/beta-fold hydrolase